MRIVLMSDVHGNLPALKAVADAVPPADCVVVAGDLCLEGAQPAETMDLLEELGWQLVKGNTDDDIVNAPPSLGKRKRRLVEWTREQLGDERIGKLALLSFSRRIEAEDGSAVLVVHANPLNLSDHLRPTMTEQELERYLDPVDAEILAFGHLHIPYVRPVEALLMIDVSSVGHPKDYDLRASFTVLDLNHGRRSVTQVRVPYDVDETVRLMRTSDMPYADEEVASLLKASY